MMTPKMAKTRRFYGTGSLFVMSDSADESWYG